MKKNKSYRVSLVCATIGNQQKTAKLAISLVNQTYNNWELLIIDQSEECVNKNLEELDSRIHVIHSAKKGLSFNRNIGLNLITGDIIGFPDDDCFYDPDVLEHLVNYSKNRVISIHPRKLFTLDSQFKLLKPVTSIFLPRDWKVYKSAISYNIFIHFNRGSKNLIKFNEDFGIGAKFGACEESELVFRLMDHGFSIDLGNLGAIWHPDKRNDEDKNVIRMENYAKGFGAYCRFLIISKHYLLAAVILIMFTRNIFKAKLGDPLALTKSSSFKWGFEKYIHTKPS